MAGRRSGYFRVSGIGMPMRSKASRWVLVGSVSIGTVTVMAVNRTWLRVKVGVITVASPADTVETVTPEARSDEGALRSKFMLIFSRGRCHAARPVAVGASGPRRAVVPLVR